MRPYPTPAKAYRFDVGPYRHMFVRCR